MDSSNLATIFGPSILHRFKPGKSHLDSLEQLSQYHDVIAVVKEMIDSFHLIFKVGEKDSKALSLHWERIVSLCLCLFFIAELKVFQGFIYFPSHSKICRQKLKALMMPMRK